MIPLSVSLDYYKRKDVREAIIENSKDREIAAKFNESFSRRPDVLRHSNDILELAKEGATSFHASEELWKNPLQLGPSLKTHELNSLRIGWDLILDIDCGFFDYSKIAADLIIKALKFHGIRSVSCKFSGNKGFHIGVPFEVFPEKIRNDETKNLFPGAPKRIALYIREMIKRELGARIMEFEKNDFNAIIKKTGKNPDEILYTADNSRSLNAEPFLTIDTILISPRHLYRMPYSLHEKSGLVSIPINPGEVLNFRKEMAIPANVKISNHIFLDKGNAALNEGRQMLMESIDFGIKEEEKKGIKIKEREFEAPEKALPEDLFPPCIRIILSGLEDGKKRALFILINYLTSIGWSHEMVEIKLKEWNSKNKEPIRENYLLGQLRYHKQAHKNILPPNCNNEMYMVGIGVCKPDNFCPRIKNPAQYTTKKAWMINKN